MTFTGSLLATSLAPVRINIFIQQSPISLSVIKIAVEEVVWFVFFGRRSFFGTLGGAFFLTFPAIHLSYKYTLKIISPPTQPPTPNPPRLLPHYPKSNVLNIMNNKLFIFLFYPLTAKAMLRGLSYAEEERFKIITANAMNQLS